MHVDCYQVQCLTHICARFTHVHYSTPCINAGIYVCVRAPAIFLIKPDLSSCMK